MRRRRMALTPRNAARGTPQQLGTAMSAGAIARRPFRPGAHDGPSRDRPTRRLVAAASRPPARRAKTRLDQDAFRYRCEVSGPSTQGRTSDGPCHGSTVSAGASREAGT